MTNDHPQSKDQQLPAQTAIAERSQEEKPKPELTLPPLPGVGIDLMTLGKVLEPGVISIVGGDISQRVLGEDGTVIETIFSSSPRAPLPPGNYVVEVLGQKVPVTLAPGQTVEIKAK